MNKKLIALAVAGATFAPVVMAQSANPVTLYGRIWVMANSVKADSGLTQLKTRTTVVDESSLIGFRGEEDLGGGLKAFFQLESAAPPDAGGGTFGSRNSGVGLRGAWGTVVLGKWDTPFKLSAIFVDPYGQNTIGNQLGVINQGDFNRRENNMMQYWTPNMAGFSARVMYGANELKGSSSTTGTTVNPSNVSFSLDYAAGPFRINYAHEEHKDTRGSVVTAGVKEKGDNISATFVLGAFKFGALSQKFTATGRENRNAYMVAMTYTNGKHELIGTYGRNKDGAPVVPAGVAKPLSPESEQVGIGYNYNFSKRSTFMARFASLVNNATSTNSTGAFGLPALSPGNDPKGLGVGVRHTF